MKSKSVPLLIAIFALAAVSKLAANWTYTGQYPWVWDAANGWNYLPASSDLVWNAGMRDWILNPYGHPVDVRGLETEDRWWLELDREGENWMILVLFTGNDEGERLESLLLLDGHVYAPQQIDYELMMREKDGMALLHVQCDTEAVTANFSLLLEFTDRGQGTYQIIGVAPNTLYASAERLQLEGHFVLK
jgi:hypothetical protein